MWVNKLLKSTGSIALLSVTCGVASIANAQTAYYQGTASLTDPVSVNISVLEGLGAPTTLPQLLNPGMLIPPTSKPVSSPTPQSVVPLAINSTAIPTSGLEGVPPTAMKVAPAPTAMKIAPTESAPAPSVAPTSGLVGAAPADTESVDEEMAAAIAASTAEQEAEAVAAEAEAVKIAEAKAADEAAVMKATKAAEAAVVVEAAKIAEEKAAEEAAKIAEATDAAAKQAEAEVVKTVEGEVEQLAAAPVAAIEETPAAEVESIVEETSTAVDEAVQETVEEVAPAAPLAEAQIASIDPNAVQTGENGTVSIKFVEGSSDLPSGVETALDELATKLTADDSIRVQLWGYAAVIGDSPSQARRLSLFRALSVRTYLMKQGVRSTRMDVRALGDKVEDGPADRVDVVFPTKS